MSDTIYDMFRRLRWEAKWWSSPVNYEGTPWDSGSSWPPDEVTITFKTALEALDELKNEIPPFEEQQPGKDENVRYVKGRAAIAMELLRAKQQYRGASVDDYLTCPELFHITRENTSILWTRPGGFKRNSVVGGEEYLKKIDGLLLLVLGEDNMRILRSRESSELSGEP